MSLEVDDPWEYELFEEVVGGMNIAKKPHKIDPSQMVLIENMYITEDDCLAADTGYKDFLGATRGVPRAQFQFFKTTGSSDNILFTNATVYKEVNGEWQYIPDDGTSTTLTGTANATDTDIDVVDDAGYADGDYIGIVLDTGLMHFTTVNGTPAGNNIVFDDALPSQVTSGNACVKAVDLNGTDNDQVSITVIPGFNYLVFTNNADNVKYYDGTDIADVPNMPSAGDCKCKAVALYENHLFLIGTTEGGTAYPQRVRRSDTADITNWTTGNAGYTDLVDSEDFALTAVPLGPYLVIYKERTIVRCEFIGASDKVFDFDTMVAGEGALSVDSVIDLGDSHIVIGNANVYKYKGGFDMKPIGDEVYGKLYGKDKEVNPDFAFRAIGMYIEELDEIWYMYPDSTSEYPNAVARMKLSTNAWVLRTLPMVVTGYGFYQTNSSLTWSELVGDWLSQTFKWGGAKTQANAPTTLLLSETGGNQCYEYDYITADDNGTAIAWDIKTKATYSPNALIRTGWLDFSAKGDTVLIQYSTDYGKTWNLWKNQTLSTEFRTYRAHKQIVGDSVMYRFSGTGTSFAIQWFGFRWMPESIH